MTKPYTTEQFWQIYETLPQDIQDALWAPQTGDNIAEITTKNGLNQYQDQITDLCGAIFLGLALPQDLQGGLEKLGIPTETATLAAQQLNGLLFYPIKPGLQKLHKQVTNKEAGDVDLGVEAPRHSETYAGDEYMVQPEEEPQAPAPEPIPEEEKKADPYQEDIDEE